MISEVMVIDPHHPLHGERLRLLSLTCARGAGFIAVSLEDGRRRLLRRAATDLDQLAAAEPEVARISVRKLLPLAQLVRRMLAVSQERTSRAEPPASCPPRPCDPEGAAPSPSATVAGVDRRGPNQAGAAGRPPGPSATSGTGGTPC